MRPSLPEQATCNNLPAGRLVCSIALVLAASCTSRGLDVPGFESDLGAADVAGDVPGIKTEFELTVVARGLPEIRDDCDETPVAPSLASMVDNTYTLSMLFHVDAMCLATSTYSCAFTVELVSITPDNPLLPPEVATAMAARVGSITVKSDPVSGTSAYRVQALVELKTTQFTLSMSLYYRALPISGATFLLVPFSMLDSPTDFEAYSGADEIALEEISAELK